ncbi:hypothetical protein, partial [Klebsiella pneumoniae]|uniref:hypothetical protein n=1 Tax=Klebsiella pneumoniae TaxID=573 RepID=UPI0013D0FBAE
VYWFANPGSNHDSWCAGRDQKIHEHALANVGAIVDGELAYLASQKKEKLNPAEATPLQMASAEKAAAVELLASK